MPTDSNSSEPRTDNKSAVIPPSCGIGNRHDIEWREPETLTPGLRAFFDPCDECFANHEPFCGGLVVRSTSGGGDKFHRPRREVETDTDAEVLVADGGYSFFDLDGEAEIHVECTTPRAEPDLCDGWDETIELDEPAFIDEDERVHFPGFDWQCPDCGNPYEFVINGVEVSQHV